jgi:MoaA/NifB/PqqE/SkfB family radical SAM enzyme
MANNLRERLEPSGIITRYDPIQRDMTILDADRKPFVGSFNQSLIAHPTRVVLEIDSRCNFRCQYCSEGFNPPKFSIPKEKVFKLIDAAEDMKVHELTLRGGEATAHPDFYEIWEYSMSKDFLSTNIITNGFVFDRDKVRELLQNPRSKIIVSLDGFPEINALYRNPTQFNKVLSWLNPTLKERPNQAVLLSVIYRQNFAQITDFARHMADKGLEFYHLSPLKRLGRSEIAESNFVSHEEMNDLQSRLEEITSSYPAFKPTISCIAIDKFRENKTSHIPMPFFTEMHYGSGVKVTPEGKVMVNRGIMFTGRFKEQYKEEACLEPLGSIYEDRSFRQIWEDSRGLRKEQGQVADRHDGYYLGWLKSLKEHDGGGKNE